MEKQGAALVDRPQSIAAGELLSKGLRFLLVRSGERFRRYRKAVHTHLRPEAAVAYQDMQVENARNVITDILNDPKNHRVHVQRRVHIWLIEDLPESTGNLCRYAASVILRLAYGKSTPSSNDDPEVVRIHQVMKHFQHAMRPGAFLVDRIPLLKYIPGYGSQLKQYHDFEIQLYRDQMDRVRSEMESNKGCNSFMRTLLEHTNDHGLERDEMAYLVGNLFGAGSETSAVGITNMIMAAACYPEAQRQVQEELDMVIGKERMPTWEDSKSLPQVHAFVLEALRWRPVTPIGFAHRATRDIVWRGQRIPRGATVIGCHW
ncbi:cytochrome P450 [Lanmaoa asiatica]|nr:cytochrome P450 [Lanmaoa asiatica]